MHVTNAQAPGCATNLAREAEGDRLTTEPKATLERRTGQGRSSE
jgi:hypothetical protein